MAYVNSRPYGSNYYEAEREVVRDAPYGSYSSEYRIDEYGNRVPHNHHHNGVAGVVSEVIPGGYQHHHHGRPAEVIERREERIVEGSYDPYQRNYY